MQKVTLASSDKDQTLAYWSDLLKLKLYTHSERQAILGYADEQAKLELQFIGEFPVILDYSFQFNLIKIYFQILEQKVEHCKAFGRILVGLLFHAHRLSSKQSSLRLKQLTKPF